MAQATDYVLANQTGANFRTELNSILAAIVSQNSGTAAPATTYAYQLWIDTGVTPALLKIRNAANSAWITIGDVTAANLGLLTTANAASTYLALAGGTLTGALVSSAGAVGTPSLTFTSDLNTGIYSPAADEVAVATGGVERIRFDATGQIEAGAIGTAASPTYTFSGDTNTGIFSTAADNISITTGGTERIRFDSTGQIQSVSLGTAAAPAYTFTGDPDTGIYSSGANTVNVTIAGTNTLTVASTVVTSAVRIAHPLGALGLPSLTFTGDTNTGIYSPGADQVSITTGGVDRLSCDASGNVVLATSKLLINHTASVYAASQEISTTGANDAASFFKYSSVAGNAAVLNFIKSSNDTAGLLTIIGSNESLATIDFRGATSASATQRFAAIQSFSDANVSTTSTPGRITFLTTDAGSTTAVERLRITRQGYICAQQGAPAAVNTTATLTAAQIAGGLITSTTAAAVTMSLPTGTDVDNAFNNLFNDASFQWSVINTGATNAVTIAASSGHTTVGLLTIAANQSGRFLTRKTAANTFVTYRISS